MKIDRIKPKCHINHTLYGIFHVQQKDNKLQNKQKSTKKSNKVTKYNQKT